MHVHCFCTNNGLVSLMHNKSQPQTSWECVYGDKIDKSDTETHHRNPMNHSLAYYQLRHYFLLLYVEQLTAFSYALALSESLKVLLLSHVRLFVTPWTVAHQAPLSMGFSRQEYWNGLSFIFSKGSSWPRDWTWVSCTAGRFFIVWATKNPMN